MQRPLIAAALAVVCVLPWDIAAARGCVSGAAVGGVAGHVAGHHALLGAAAGCAINHHRDKVRDRRARDPQATADAREAERQRRDGNPSVTTVATPR